MRLVAALVVTSGLAASVLAIGGCADAGAARNATRAGFYAAPTGTATGDGSAHKPWDLATALSHPRRVHPGDTIWLRGGTYRGVFVGALTGTPGTPVVLRALPGERATVDGTLEVRGANAVYWGFEVMNSDTTRVTGEIGSHPVRYSRPGGVSVVGPGVKLVNLVVHDVGVGVGLDRPAIDAELYGSLIFNNGWQGADRGHGHGVYSQNQNGTKRIIDNIIFNQFGLGIHIYGTEAAYLRNFDVRGNVAFGNGTLARIREEWDILIGGGRSAEHIVVAENYTFRNSVGLTARFGYGDGVPNEDLTLTSNYFVGVTEVKGWRQVAVTGNTFAGGPYLVEVRVPPGQSVRDYRWHHNRYLMDATLPSDGPTLPFQLTENGTRGVLNFADWQATTGLDAGSCATRERPTGTRVFVRPNDYEPGRAHVIVYNWDRRPWVDVDLSAVLRPGDRYEIRDAQRYFEPPVARGTYRRAYLPGLRLPVPWPRSGPTVRVPMTRAEPTPPIGNVPTPPVATGPDFGVFVVVRQDG